MGKTQYTTYTPLPSGVPRLLAIDMLHSHGEIIELNPLVLEHHPVKAPKNAAPDEFFAVWHEITERIQYVPGMGKMGSGKISFKGVFHDMPWGLQTHIYAPAGVEMRNKYQIKGNQPGEPLERALPTELRERATQLWIKESDGRPENDQTRTVEIRQLVEPVAQPESSLWTLSSGERFQPQLLSTYRDNRWLPVGMALLKARKDHSLSAIRRAHVEALCSSHALKNGKNRQIRANTAHNRAGKTLTALTRASHSRSSSS